jgi:hypothetical protein
MFASLSQQLQEKTTAAKGDPSLQDGTAPVLRTGYGKSRALQARENFQDLMRRKRNQKEDDLWPI